ncbi:MAG: hypothetical protein IH830_03060 [Planctomycetes bacterium]|nr:hypothetical protein [Planctomycetota bacterium]
MSNQVDWNEEAVKAANNINQDEDLRVGAMDWWGPPNTVVVFCKPGDMGAETSQKMIERVRQMLKRQRVKELGYGVSKDGHTWAMIVTTPDREIDAEKIVRLQKGVVKAWRVATGRNG